MQDFHLKLTDWFLILPLALLAYVAHIPGFGYLRVDGLALLVALFSICRKQGFPLILAFCIGLLQDIVSLAPLGQHAIGLVALSYVCQTFRDRILMDSIVKQLSTIFLCMLMLKFIHSWVVALGFGQLPTSDSFISVVVTTAFWPLIVRISFILVRRRDTRKVGFS